jgi:hypothetical protein
MIHACVPHTFRFRFRSRVARPAPPPSLGWCLLIRRYAPYTVLCAMRGRGCGRVRVRVRGWRGVYWRSCERAAEGGGEDSAPASGSSGDGARRKRKGKRKRVCGKRRRRRGGAGKVRCESRLLQPRRCPSAASTRACRRAETRDAGRGAARLNAKRCGGGEAEARRGGRHANRGGGCGCGCGERAGWMAGERRRGRKPRGVSKRAQRERARRVGAG